MTYLEGHQQRSSSSWASTLSFQEVFPRFVTTQDLAICYSLPRILFQILQCYKYEMLADSNVQTETKPNQKRSIRNKVDSYRLYKRQVVCYHVQYNSSPLGARYIYIYICHLSSPHQNFELLTHDREHAPPRGCCFVFSWKPSRAERRISLPTREFWIAASTGLQRSISTTQAQ